MKGQTQALTAVLITSVTIGAIATAYVWGTPLLEKRQSRAELESVEREVFKLHDSIVSTAQNGGQDTPELSIPNGRLNINEAEDYIEITTSAQGSPYPSGSWTLLEGTSLQNLSIGSGSYAIKGRNLPGVIAVRSAIGAGESVVTYRIEFRNLKLQNQERLEKIDLNVVGRSTATEEATLNIRRGRTYANPIKVETGQTFDRELTEIIIDIR